jgi:hypothetical protein
LLLLFGVVPLDALERTERVRTLLDRSVTRALPAGELQITGGGTSWLQCVYA